MGSPITDDRALADQRGATGGPAGDAHRDAVRASLDRAVRYLRSVQDPAGWWKGELQTNVTMDAEDLLLRRFLGILEAPDAQAAARWIRSQQRDDGTWATFHGGPADLSTTVEAWVALRLAGDASDAPHMARAAAFIRARGGVPATRVFTRIWLALFGQVSWDDLPDMPPELIFLPRWMPLNIYDWGCWARQTIVPLTIVCTLRPTRPLGFDLAELEPGLGEASAGDRGAARPARRRSWQSRAFGVLDTVLHAYSRHPIRPLRRLAMRRGVEWVLARQESDGGWGGIQPPWVYSLLAMHLLGYGDEHPAMRAGIAGLEGFLIREDSPDGPQRRLEACQSPVWDTALALTGLLDAGMAPDDPTVRAAADWLVGEEIRVVGDWAVRRPGLAPGGWAFEFANDLYPDTDDTAEIVLALRRVRGGDEAARAASVRRGIDWTVGMQSRDGGWGAFDADNTRTTATQLPFCDFGAVIDPPSADVTAHIVEMLAHAGQADGEPCRRGVQWLIDAQEADGSWFGRWGANYVYGTGAAVPALIAAGMPASAPEIRVAIRWLSAHQNADGGWGEDLRSYVDDAWRGRGDSTASQTAWALLALIAAGEAESDSARRGAQWLMDTQLDTGTWDEPQFTGTGFPGDFYINYHLYRVVFPVSALGRYARSIGARSIGEAGGGEAGDGGAEPTDSEQTIIQEAGEAA
jgi:squalene-hopene/tetraprenyl-beta-curcumene cyclase